MQAAILVTWTHPVAGREAKALQYGDQVMKYWQARANEGKCSEPEIFFSERGTGMWIVKGDRDTLMQIHDTDDARLLTMNGGLLLEGFSVDFCYAGDAAADFMARYASALSTIG